MAVISKSKVEENYTNPENGYAVYQWLAVTENDTCEAVMEPTFSEVTMKAWGTFGTGGEGHIQGTLHFPSETETWLDLNDLQGSAIALTAAGITLRLENTVQVRPHVGAGTSVSMNFRLMFSGPRRGRQ